MVLHCPILGEAPVFYALTGHRTSMTIGISLARKSILEPDCIMRSCRAMNILQVTEQYTMGGLEKFIDALSEEFQARGNRTYLAIGNYNAPSDALAKGQDTVFSDFGFKDNASQSIASFNEDVERLCEIIEEYGIDFVLIHPFYSLFPALTAAKLMEIPAFYVIHGRGSCSFSMQSNINALFRVALDCSVNHIFVTQQLFQNYLQPGAASSILRNPINGIAKRDRESALLKTRYWAICSRLDPMKEKAIKDILVKLPNLDIDHLDIYGDGPSSEVLQAFANNHGLSDRITWHGHKADWLARATENDCGVIGLGRVAIEALAANLPVLLLGIEGGICGLVDRNIFEQSQCNNFGKAGLPVVDSIEELNGQLNELLANPEPYLLSEETHNLFFKSQVADDCLQVCRQFVDSKVNKLTSEWRTFAKVLKDLPALQESYSTSVHFAHAVFCSFIASVPFAVTRNALFEMYDLSNTTMGFDGTNQRLDLVCAQSATNEGDIASLKLENDLLKDEVARLEAFVSTLRNTLPFRMRRFARRLLDRED